ncbi:MAG: helix-turn-helix transcriptional regulator [Oscillospiraceae bacterium]|nr:helix-turn-helix transcriptional regulator [Oscillospiraceae bacterium]
MDKQNAEWTLFRDNILRRIDQLRTENGLSFYELAKRSQISDNTLRSLMKKNNLPNLYSLHQLCRGLGITEAEFFSFQEHKTLSAKESQIICRIRDTPKHKQDLLIDFLIQFL